MKTADLKLVAALEAVAPIMARVFAEIDANLTPCCKALTTFHDDVEVCKGCWKEVVR